MASQKEVDHIFKEMRIRTKLGQDNQTILNEFCLLCDIDRDELHTMLQAVRMMDEKNEPSGISVANGRGMIWKSNKKE